MVVTFVIFHCVELDSAVLKYKMPVRRWAGSPAASRDKVFAKARENKVHAKARARMDI